MSVRIVVPDDFPSLLSGTAAEQHLRTLGDVTVFTERGANEEAELVRRVRDADVVMNIRAYARFPESVLAACPRLRMISVWGTGMDHVDLAACRARNVTVTNTPGVNANSVAEHTLALILAVTRRIPQMDRSVRAAEWPRAFLVQLEGKTLGIVGLGATGTRVATLAKPFGMRLLATSWGPDNGRAAAAGAAAVPIETLLRESDIVTLHLRLGPDTERYLDRERLQLMKPTAFLVNTARARLVDKDALVEALDAGWLAGAGLDVFHHEPIEAGDPLIDLPNVVLSPHNAWLTPEVIDAGFRLAVENIERFLRSSDAPV